MTDNKWTSAGWFAVVAAALTPPNFIVALMADIGAQHGGFGLPLAILAAGITGAVFVCSLIALYRFRQLLNERLQYHGIDGLVTLVIVLLSVLSFFVVFGRPVLILLGATDNIRIMLTFLTPVLLLGAVIGVASIVIGAKLLSVDSDLGLMRPYAILSIVGGACIALVVLAPIGMVTMIAENIVLAVMFFRAGQQPAHTVEFV